MDIVHGIREAQSQHGKTGNVLLWDIRRSAAWRRITEVILIVQALVVLMLPPKGLRHTLGVVAIQNGIALNIVQKWLSHADLTTIAIYADAIGPEEQDIAAKMWS